MRYSARALMLGRSLVPVALAVWLVLASCSGVARVPSRTPAGWLELDSPHFRLRTDLPRERAVETLEQLEQLLAAFLTLGWEARGAPDKLDIAVFHNPEDVYGFGNFNGFYLRSGLLAPLAVAAHLEESDALSTVKHEITHHIAFQAIAKQPPWFAEGIAVYYSTAWLAGRRFELGRVPAELLWYGLMPAATLLSPDADRTDRRFYSSAWLLTHYLTSHRRDDFLGYQRTLARGYPFAAAWALHFGDLAPERLDEVLPAYLSSGELPMQRFRVSRDDVPVRVRALGSAPLHALRARLYFTQRPGDDWNKQAHRNLELALQADPDSVDAALVRIAYATSDRSEQLALARALTARHPGHWQAWLARASLEEEAAVAGEPVPPSDSIERLLALRPDHPRGTMFAARRALRAGHGAAARAMSARALGAAPSDTLLVKMRVEILDRTGGRAEACVLLRNLAGMLDDASERAFINATFSRHCHP